MYRYLFLLFLLKSLFAINQIAIPLSTENGIPFFEYRLGKCVKGFDIDQEGNLYFLGDTVTTLTKFSSKGKAIYRKKFSQFGSNAISLKDEKIYIFDKLFKRNNLYVLNAIDGSIDTFFTKISDRKVNSYLYFDFGIVLEVFTSKYITLDFRKDLEYLMFSLSGMFLRKIPNRYNLKEKLFLQEYDNYGTRYLGKWKDFMVLYVWDIDNPYYKIGLVDKDGNMVKMVKIYDKIFGEVFYDAGEEHWKLINGFLYVLGYKGDTGLITILDMNKLFNEKWTYTINDTLNTNYNGICKILYLKEYLSELSLEELKIERNEIFARHGRIFKTKWLQDYFNKQTWYQPNPDYSDDMLTDNEKELIKIIKTIENEKQSKEQVN